MSTWFSIKITIFDVNPNFVFNGFIRTTSIIATEYTIDGFFPSGDGFGDAANKFAKNKGKDGIDNTPKLVNSGTTYSFTDIGTTVKDIFSVPYQHTKYYTLWNHINDARYPVIYTYNDKNEFVYGYTPAFEIYRLNSDPSCYNEGTKILCLNKNLEEEYIPIENLRKGDLVKSYKHGYRKIDLIGKKTVVNNPEKLNCMYKMKKTDENGLIEDLIITGGHAILVDHLGIFKEENDKLFGSTQMIDDKYLLLAAVSNQFVKLENIIPYTYYHFILENNGSIDERFGVWANGILTETPSKDYFMSHKYTLL